MRLRRIAAAALACALILSPEIARARDAQNNQNDVGSLKQLSLERLGNVEVTTASKQPKEVWKTPAAIYVITQEDIHQIPGATSIPVKFCGSLPGVEIGPHRLRPLVCRHTRVRKPVFEGGAGFNRRAKRLHTAIRWRLLGDSGHSTGRHRAHRSYPRTWRDDLGSQCRQWNHKYHLQKMPRIHARRPLRPRESGNVDQAIGGARFGGSNGKGFNYRVYGKGFLRGPEFHPDNSNFDYWKTGQLGFRTDSNLTDRDTLTVQGRFVQRSSTEKKYPSRPIRPPSVAIIDAPHEVSGGNILGRWQRKFSENSDVQVQACLTGHRALRPPTR